MLQGNNCYALGKSLIRIRTRAGVFGLYQVKRTKTGLDVLHIFARTFRLHL